MGNMQRTVLVLTLINAGLLGSQASNRLSAAPATEAVVRTNVLELVDAIARASPWRRMVTWCSV